MDNTEPADKKPVHRVKSIKSKVSEPAVNSKLSVSRNPTLPLEVNNFTRKIVIEPTKRLTAEEWVASLHGTEIRDKDQQITLRPYFAGGVFILILVQNVGIWFIIVWALNTKQLADLQLVFGTLVAGTLTQSYFILRFITNKVFSDIDYHNDQ